MIRITLDTKETIDVLLYENKAPITVKNFLKLIDQKYFDGVIFHRIIKDFMVQAGGYKIDGNNLIEAGDAETIKGEFEANGIKNDIKHVKGVISMARTNIKDSASSQFFICTADVPHLDGQYAAFGKVADDKSLEVLEKLNNARTEFVSNAFADFPYPFITIESIRVI